eukprot:CAMPEP_0198230594 /NCGR_PEP_ID=MMETSP1445-20131203/114745_1 /TAXON_ID=36898 /ORGANISM="Pyramimonas sp., Strain CCMP2087" /LENGTH=366 /DNA_ID=CAMNT_0043911151 /DNA_START=128 /DNA_END=1225 /DNA_ORIENTATION=+
MKLGFVARGVGGIEEMNQHTSDSAVMYGLLRFQFGHGNFARNKYVFVHFNGENCSIVKRGRFNAMKPEAESQIGMSHTEVQFNSTSEFTVDEVLEVLRKACANDGNLGQGSDFSVSQMKADMEKMLEKAKEDLQRLESSASAPAEDFEANRPGMEMTAKDLNRDLSWTEALQMVRADMGPFNWMLISPDPNKPELINAGAGSVRQMHEYLKDDQVVYGLIRMGFGKGQFRRSKWIFLHWSGEGVKAIKRGKFNAVDGDMKLLLGSHNVYVHASTRDSCTLEEVIDKVQRSVVTDGAASDTDLFSMDAFLEALDEEQKAVNEAFKADMSQEEGLLSPKKKDKEEAQPKMPLADAIESVRSNNEPYNW